MAQMLNDLITNIYNRISQLGQSINTLKESIEQLNNTVDKKITTLVDGISRMTDNVEKEGEEMQLIFKEIGKDALSEIGVLHEKIGLKDLNELMEKLKQITASSEEALRPEVIDLLLGEVLAGVKQIKGDSGEGGDDTDLLEKVGNSLSIGAEIPVPAEQPSAPVPAPTGNAPPMANPPPTANAPPMQPGSAPPMANPPPTANAPPGLTPPGQKKKDLSGLRPPGT